MYRPQYLEQKYEVITVHKGNGEKVYEYRRPIKSDTYKRKENNEVIPLYGKRIAKQYIRLRNETEYDRGIL